MTDDWQNNPRSLAAAFEGMAENQQRPAQERVELALQAIRHLHEALEQVSQERNNVLLAIEDLKRANDHLWPVVDGPSAEELLRIAIGTGLIQSGYYDQDPDTGIIGVVQWHPCPECPRPETGRCGCSGVPYLSQAIWDAADKFGDLTRALVALRS